MNHGFVKVAAITPHLQVADCTYNAQQITHDILKAAQQGAQIIALPELCLTGYTCGDLFLQPTLLDGAKVALHTIAQATKAISALIVLGVPLLHRQKLYNCAVFLHRGSILGAVPKTFLPNYGEFHEMRHFSPAPAQTDTLVLNGQEIPFGTKLLFACENLPTLCIAAEICEDLWAPLPPSTAHALAGATLVLNLSASDELVGKAAYRRALVSGQSARLLCGYVYCDAGSGESTTDMVFAGHNLIAENGTILVESKLFENDITLTDIDTQALAFERAKNTTFIPSGNAYMTIPFALSKTAMALTRCYSCAPFVPDDIDTRQMRCEAILTMQANALTKRLQHTGCRTAVIGVSGGLDSTLALLVIVRAFALLQKPLVNIVAVTMPCFGTTHRTRSNAEIVCTALGVTLQEINIENTVHSNFNDIAHDINTHDVTFENTQARVRTLVLMNLANEKNGLVIGTGDLSELALGWATYNGDHMSMYGINASIPKTLVRHLVAYVADTAQDRALTQVLGDILATPVSPELLPAQNGEMSQQTEKLVGPYELHDFFLYYAIRWGFSPTKVFFLAQTAFGTAYDSATLMHWLRNFYKRFFGQQFKRSCLPDGPKIGSVSLSPRGDWRMPSDASSALWLAELEAITL